MDREAWRATYSPWGRQESDMTERLSAAHSISTPSFTGLGGGGSYIFTAGRSVFVDWTATRRSCQFSESLVSLPTVAIKRSDPRGEIHLPRKICHRRKANKCGDKLSKPQVLFLQNLFKLLSLKKCNPVLETSSRKKKQAIRSAEELKKKNKTQMPGHWIHWV